MSGNAQTATALPAAQLERRIRLKGQEALSLAVARDSLGARRCYVELAALIAHRSPETVRFMEAQRGLQ